MYWCPRGDNNVNYIQCKWEVKSPGLLKCSVCKREMKTEMPPEKVHTMCGSGKRTTVLRAIAKPREQEDVEYIINVLCPSCPAGHYRPDTKT